MKSLNFTFKFGDYKNRDKFMASFGGGLQPLIESKPKDLILTNGRYMELFQSIGYNYRYEIERYSCVPLNNFGFLVSSRL